jgi:hypothetical protein
MIFPSRTNRVLRFVSAVLFCAALAAIAAHTHAQPQLPRGYHLLTDASDSCIVSGDFDGDGKTDLFCAATRQGGSDAQLLAVISGSRATLASGSLSMCCGSISLKGKVVEVHSRGNRSFSYYKFRWDAAAKDFRLVGYDTESFGNAVHDGSGTTSLNLLTGDYEASLNSWSEQKQDLIPHQLKKKIAIRKKIYLKSFDEKACDWLMDTDYNNMPKELR